MEFQSFDAEYVQRLTTGDAETERHFTAYFRELMFLKLRRRLSSPQNVEDVAQETLTRVFQKLRQGDGLRHPERLGSFVNSVCNNVVLEKFRSLQRHSPMESEPAELVDEKADMDAPLVRRERKKFVQRMLAELAEKDRALLRMIFFEERDREAICQEMGVTSEYLRVLVHRAKKRFREIAERFGGLPRGLLLLA